MQPNNEVQNSSPAPEADDFFAAAINGDTNRITSMLSQGIDINTPNRERETALHMAAARGHYSMVIYLINNGAYAHARTIKNWVPLHHAVRFRHHNIANFLVKHGSSPHERTSDGKSAIDMAKGVNDYRLLSILGSK
jgi:ankyrin repeat protein